MEKVFDQYMIDVNDKRKQIGAVHVDVRFVAHDDDICFLSKAFKNLVREKKIKQVVIPPYTHAMMGAVEGYMKHVKQGTIKLRHQSGLPNFLWDELMGAYVYQRNRSYTSACNTSMHKYNVRMCENSQMISLMQERLCVSGRKPMCTSMQMKEEWARITHTLDMFAGIQNV